MNLFLWSNSFGFIREILFLWLFISWNIILTQDILPRTLFSRLFDWAKLCENKGLMFYSTIMLGRWNKYADAPGSMYSIYWSFSCI